MLQWSGGWHGLQETKTRTAGGIPDVTKQVWSVLLRGETGRQQEGMPIQQSQGWLSLLS
jgi:hypothetical protein